jgi:cell division protein ZapD
MSQITYEQPLNERVRTFLRLEFLFAQIDHTRMGESPWDSRATLASLIDVMNILSRTDLKSEIIMELERQIANLSPLEDSPNIDHAKLGQILDQMDLVVDRLHVTQGQIGQHLRQNEFINSIKQRSSISGGTCGFDLPAYHFWLHQPSKVRFQNLQEWLSTFDNIRSSVDLILHLIRDSAAAKRESAIGGFFQQSLDINAPYQLIRVTLPAESPYFTEISGGKHRFTVRFMEMSLEERPSQTSSNVDFDLTCCMI